MPVYQVLQTVREIIDKNDLQEEILCFMPSQKPLFKAFAVAQSNIDILLKKIGNEDIETELYCVLEENTELEQLNIIQDLLNSPRMILPTPYNEYVAFVNTTYLEKEIKTILTEDNNFPVWKKKITIHEGSYNIYFMFLLETKAFLELFKLKKFDSPYCQITAQDYFYVAKIMMQLFMKDGKNLKSTIHLFNYVSIQFARHFSYMEDKERRYLQNEIVEYMREVLVEEGKSDKKGA
jgi:hypothetical protein